MTQPRRSIAELLVETARVYRDTAGTLLVLAGGVVMVVDVILGLGLGELTSGYRSRSPAGSALVTLAASVFVTTPLITAMVAKVVVGARDGGRVPIRVAANAGFDVFAPLLAVVVAYVLAVTAGALVFVLPGLYVAVVWYFFAQAFVIDGRRGTAALLRSSELVSGNWWSALATGVVFNGLAALLGSLASVAFNALAREANSRAVIVAGDIIFETLALSFIAIGATLFYLDLRERR